MGNYTEDSKQLLEYVGGKENIAAVSHCMTRMRFVLADPKKADVKKIEAMKIVKGSFTQGWSIPSYHRQYGRGVLQGLHGGCWD